ncbi:unnamed protein product, partial [Rotaria sordida]
PNKPKVSSTSECHNSSKVIRKIEPKNKKKTKQTTNNDNSTVSTSETIPHPITILRKPNISFKEEETNTSSIDNQSLLLPSHELLSILQSVNCLSSLNEYAQQKKFTLNYEYSSISPSSFTFHQFVHQKLKHKKLARDPVLRILYRESCNKEQFPLKFSDKHDYIAHQSISKFQNLNINELLLGRKTLACMLMITDGQYEQARNSCPNETNLIYANDGIVLHDCHSEILAHRGLIRFLFEQIKQSKDNQSSIFEYNSTINEYQLHYNIAFHMYISSLLCGNASFNILSNSIRYKQGQTEGTILYSTNSIQYSIKSCSDKIYRWNILGIQGGLLINLLTKPIYLESITLACEATFDPKLQTSAFAWNTTKPDRMELLEPMTGKLRNDRSMSLLSKRNLFEDFTNFIQANFPDNNSLSYTTYQQAKQLNKTYVAVKDLISTAFQSESSDTSISWLSKSDKLEQFSME